ncbi:MAG: hypothetical protein KKG92_00910 [Gammaproteobacteria bacterium]|nr:hypothetical protein [Gammaproteobacteria bacterium]
MNKRKSSPPRRPRDPVAKAVRTPRFKQQVVPDKRWRERLKEKEEAPEKRPMGSPPPLPKGE